MLHPILALIDLVLSLYMTAVFIWAILSWLITFGVINSYSPFVMRVNYFLSSIIEPALRRLRRFVPIINGIDLSPIALLIGLYFIRYCLRYYFA